MSGPFRSYWFECRHCGFLASNLPPAIGQASAHKAIDEASRLNALKSLRLLNFERVLDQLALLDTSENLSLLDVGCGHGWFLQAAARRGYTTLGIEPDVVIAAQAQAAGLDVISGFFPHDLPPGARFDIITFNDVFEHLPAPQEAADACFTRLRPHGLLAVTLPSSKGILFRIARALSAIGVHGPLDRLWQRDFPSPHLSYFHPEGLASFLLAHGFREVHGGSLPSVSRQGLWQRLRYDRRSSVISSAALYVLLYLLIPVLGLLPVDISFQVFQRVGSDDVNSV